MGLAGRTEPDRTNKQTKRRSSCDCCVVLAVTFLSFVSKGALRPFDRSPVGVLEQVVFGMESVIDSIGQRGFSGEAAASLTVVDGDKRKNGGDARAFSSPQFRLSEAELARADLRPNVSIRYCLHGPEDGPLFVCISGFSNECSSFHPMARTLAAEGFRVLSFDWVSRGYSSGDIVSYPICDGDYYVDQIRSLLERLQIHLKPITLIAYSMGGVAAALYTKKYGSHVRALVLLAPAGLKFPLPLSGRIVRWIIIGYVIFKLIGAKALRDSMACPGTPQYQCDMLEFQLSSTPGFLDSIHSTLRHFPLNDAEGVWREVAHVQRPTLLLWGDSDTIVPFSVCQHQMKDILAGGVADEERTHLESFVFSGAGHDFLISHKNETAALVVEWAKRKL